MEILGYLIVAAIMIAAFAYAFLPLAQPAGGMAVAGAAGGGADKEIAHLVIERERAYKNIQDIELDWEMEKLSKEDYEDMLGRGRARALEVLRRLEGRGVKEGTIPLHLSEREAVSAALQQKGAAPAVPEPTLDEALEAEILRNRKVLPSKEPETDSPEAPAPAPATAPAVNFCPECGREAVETDNYCSGCGKKLK
ncbi:MAG: zinc ribbon domain-containing protein [Nitrospinota bacterium]